MRGKRPIQPNISPDGVRSMRRGGLLLLARDEMLVYCRLPLTFFKVTLSYRFSYTPRLERRTARINVFPSERTKLPAQKSTPTF